jgi:endonuclease V-like protein UPF0215 family
MKQQIRLLGVDDSPFKFQDRKATVVGALVRLPNYLEGVMTSKVTVDGSDASDVLIEMVSSSRYRDQIKAVVLDGIALAGFNVLDLERIHKTLGTPVLTVTRDKPDLDKMRLALSKHFSDWEDRYSLITRLELRQVRTEHKSLWASGLGLDWPAFEELVRLSIVRGAVPEPVRMAHLIASAIVKGESYGRS